MPETTTGNPVHDRSARPQAVVVLGGGFAGRAAARALQPAMRRQLCRITLVDANPFTVMIPALPDYAAGDIPKTMITAPLAGLLPESAIFRQTVVTAIDLAGQSIDTSDGKLFFDYLVMAMGSVGAPERDNWPTGASFSLATIGDAERIRNAFPNYLKHVEQPRLLISGAGYTGIELAIGLSQCAARLGVDCRIQICERHQAILPFLNGFQLKRVAMSLRRHRVELLTGCHVEHFDGKTAMLSNGERIENVFLCRTEGTCAPLRPDGGNFDTLPDGRIMVDRRLCLPAYPKVYAAGDAAAIRHGNGYLRKAVNFAVYSGTRAGYNVHCSLINRPQRIFRGLDPGWLIPLGDDSVGRALGGVPLLGRWGLMLHYIMCGLRNYNMRNAIGFARHGVGALIKRKVII